MSRFHDLMAADLAPAQAPAAQPGESTPAEQPDATGTPSAPAHALGEESASQTTTPATETTATAATTSAEPAAVEQPAAAQGEQQPPANEPPAVPQMRQTIEALKSKLDEQKTLLDPVTSRFASEDEMRPFLSVVDAARERDPLQAASKVGDSLFQMLGAERYGALVGDLVSQHLDFIIEANRDEITKRLGVTPAAHSDERVFEEDDDEPPAKTANLQLTQLQQENETLKAQLAQLNGQTTAAQEQQRIATMRGQVLGPLQKAMQDIAALGAGFEEVPERIRVEVLSQFNSNPQLAEAFETAAEMAAKGEPAHLYSPAIKAMREAIEAMTVKAMEYHKRIAGTPATQQQSYEKAAAAATQTEKVEVVRAASSAQPVQPPAPPVTRPQEPVGQSLKKQLFNKGEIKQGLNEMRQAGRL